MFLVIELNILCGFFREVKKKDQQNAKNVQGWNDTKVFLCDQGYLTSQDHFNGLKHIHTHKRDFL